jgi:hypothetical protein
VLFKKKGAIKEVVEDAAAKFQRSPASRSRRATAMMEFSGVLAPQRKWNAEVCQY